MKAFRKLLKITFLITVSGIILGLLLNSFDSSLDKETAEILNIANGINSSDEKKCAAMLGLVVDPTLDSASEGFKIFEEIKKASLENNRFKILLAPYDVKRIETKEECKAGCHFSEDEKKRLKEEIERQRVFLTRFEQLMDMANIRCQAVDVVFRVPLSGLLTLAKNKILEYQLLAEEGRTGDAANGLMKMNRFFEQSLSDEKYTFIMGMINISILQHVRETLVNLKPHGKIPLEFVHFKYEDIVKRGRTGEIQLTSSLLRKPLDYRFFEIFDIAHDKVVSAKSTATLLQSAIDGVTNYFFLPNETLNDMLEIHQAAAWHPCIGQNDISCELKSKNFLTFIRNPVGKSLLRIMTNGNARTFKKLKGKIEALNKFSSIGQIYK